MSALSWPPGSRKVLIVADECGERIIAGGETQRHLLHRRAGGGLSRPLRDLKTLMAESGHGFEPGPARGGEIGDMKHEIARALLDQAASTGRAPASRIAGCGVREDGCRCPLGICEREISLSGRSIYVGEVIRDHRHIRMVGAERLLVNGERPLVELYRLVVFALRLVHFGEGYEVRGHTRIARTESLLLDGERALDQLCRLRIFGLV
jgi:hypothetical protein